MSRCPDRINPALRLGTRQGRVVAWLPGAAEARPLTAREFDGLQSLLGPAGSPAPDDADLAAWRAAALVLPPQDDDPPDTPPGIELPPAQDAPPLPARLACAASVCLLPGAGTWLAWSAPLRSHVRLPAALARAVLGVGDGRSAADCGVPEPDLARLLAAGLLVAAPARTGPPTPSGADARDDAPVHLRAGDPWAGLNPDGRRPIYFVTHQADHLPLALGMLRAQVLAHDDGALLRHYLPLPIVSMAVPEIQALYGRFGPGVWLFSDYMWSLDFNLTLSGLVKAVDPRNLTVHGGPSAPKYEDACRLFMAAHPHVDIVVRGAGEHALVEMLQALARPDGEAALGGVAGLTYFADGALRQRLVRTPERLRTQDLAGLASPYLSGMFDHYGGQVVAAILETNRGCPFACTFCDWGSATQEKIRSFDLDRVKAEIDWIGRHHIRVLWIADANYGIFERDVEIARHIAETKQRHGFPREVVVNYPKNATEKIARIVRIFVQAGICGQGIISIQTTDPATLKAIRRDNIKTRKYDELGEIFRSENLPLSTDLMIGLPGATVKSFKADLQYYFDDDVGVKAYRTELLPNAPMADPAYRREHAIQVDADNFLVSTSSYTEADLAEMMAIWSAFDLADGYAVLRYALRYLQWEHGIAATECLHALVRQVDTGPARYPALSWLLRQFHVERLALGGWGPLYAEFGRFAGERFGVPMDSGFGVALRVNELLMPQPGRRFPETHGLAHDFVAWFRSRLRARAGTARRLADHPPGVLRITDPDGLCGLDFRQLEQYDNHQVFYDLPAGIGRRRSAPNFVLKAA